MAPAMGYIPSMPQPSRSRAPLLRRFAVVALALLLPACTMSSPPGSDDPDGGNGGEAPTGTAWYVLAPDLERIDGATATVAGDQIVGTDSTPSGWRVVLENPGGFSQEGYYASLVSPVPNAVSSELTLSITAPGGASCSIGPDETIENPDGDEDPTYSGVTYTGKDDASGWQQISGGLFAACPGMPGADGDGAVLFWAVNFGSQ